MINTETDRSAYESVTAVSQARPAQMSPYVGYDYPKREKKRRHHHHRRRRDEEDGRDEDEEEEAPKSKAGAEGLLAQGAVAPTTAQDGQCADDEEECWECDDDDDDNGENSTYNQYQMCM